MSTEGLPAELAGVTNRKLVLRRRPSGLVQPDDVELVTEPLPVPGPGEALVKVAWLGIDATVRTWLSKAEGYIPPVEIGEVVRCSGIGRVVASRSDRLPVGSMAHASPAGRSTPSSATTRCSPPRCADGVDRRLAARRVRRQRRSRRTWASTDVAQVKEGETVVVSAAAGATGSIAVQIAKHPRRRGSSASPAPTRSARG